MHERALDFLASDLPWQGPLPRSELASGFHDRTRCDPVAILWLNIVFLDCAPDSSIGIVRLHLSDVDGALS